LNCNTKNKNKNYETLTGLHSILKQRYEISALFARNISQKEWFATAIALQVGISESTIGRQSAKEIGVKIYFANPYHSWERELNRSGEP
jgi:IS30 family transposase